MTSEKNLENNLHRTERTAAFPVGPITRAIVAIVNFSRQFRWGVLALAALLTVASGYYAITHFAINTNTEDFISARLPWRQNLIAAQKAFPQRDNQILVVIDGKTTELAENAAAKLTASLKTQPNLFETVVRPDGGPYFNQSALLFLPLPELKTSLQQLSRSAPFLGVLSADPSLRGVADAFSFIPRAVRGEAGTLDDFKAPMISLNATLQGILNGQPEFFSWRSLLTNEKPGPNELRRFITAKPILDYSSLTPGEAATDFIRKTAHDLGFGAGSGVTVRLTGPVPLADDEFSTVADGAGLNSALTALVVLFIIWRALHSLKIVFAVVLSVTAGLAITAAIGLLMVGALNLISVAFAVLFVGIGADFCIQFSVRYRAERYEESEFKKALGLAAAKVGRPLALAAVATAVGFYSFLPTDYRGVSELGLIAGTGMFVAFFCSITVLPALLAILQPPAEQEPMGYAFLAPVDHFLSHHRHLVVYATLAVALLGSPLLTKLKFDFNPLNLRSNKVQSISTLLDLMKDPSTDTNTVDVIAPSLEAAKPVIAKLERLPDVAKVMTLESLIPPDQKEKLPLIGDTAKTLLPVLDPAKALTPPTDEEDVNAIRKGANAFKSIAGDKKDEGAVEARALAQSLNALADAPPAMREDARNIFLPSLKTLLSQLRNALSAKPVSIASIPADLARDWISADGQARIQIAPKGDPNNNANLVRFAHEVESIDPKATGEPIAIQESGKTVIRAFIEAGSLALAAICVLLYISLRRIKDVFLTIVPLLVAGVFTLEITVLIGLPLNFANIIALPLLLGLGVAFKIYFVMAWRAGTTNFLQSSLTRAVFFSALTTATAFGSLWLSNHPGTSSMGKLLALSLTCTLASAILFQPALMGPPRAKPEPGKS